ncbi:MAG: zinc-binding dehydrogenase [Chloroflexi bacterium]|nr:zinc-binding dehydrogenase [Chloroflexota bacterium]
MEGKVAVFRGKREFELKSFPVPDPAPGAAIIKTSLANICGSDLHIWRGEMASVYPPTDNGYVVGHEMTGRILALGDGVSKDSLGRPLGVGDRVAHCYFYPCGRCRTCLRGDLYCCPFKGRFPRIAGVAPYFVAAYGEYYYLHPGHFVFKVPDEIPDELVAPLNCALSQVLFGLQHVGLRFGDYLVVQGAGGLGLYATAVAKEMGAAKVIVIDALENRLELARAFGADEVINLTKHPTVAERVGIVKELTDGYGADVAMDVVGIPSVIQEGIQLIRDGGRYLEIGCICPGPTFELEPGYLVRHSKRIVAILQYDPSALADAIEFVRRNLTRLPFEKILSHKFAFEDINEAFQKAEWFGRQTEAPITRAALVAN